MNIVRQPPYIRVPQQERKNLATSKYSTREIFGTTPLLLDSPKKAAVEAAIVCLFRLRREPKKSKLVKRGRRTPLQRGILHAICAYMYVLLLQRDHGDRRSICARMACFARRGRPVSCIKQRAHASTHVPSPWTCIMIYHVYVDMQRAACLDICRRLQLAKSSRLTFAHTTRKKEHVMAFCLPGVF